MGHGWPCPAPAQKAVVPERVAVQPPHHAKAPRPSKSTQGRLISTQFRTSVLSPAAWVSLSPANPTHGRSISIQFPTSVLSPAAWVPLSLPQCPRPLSLSFIPITQHCDRREGGGGGKREQEGAAEGKRGPVCSGALEGRSCDGVLLNTLGPW